VVSPLEIATDGMRVRDVGGDVGLRPAGESDSAEEDASGKAAR
jgi:hypothetical protein